MRAMLFACIALLALTSGADARPRHHHHRHHVSHDRHAHSGYGPRPSAWCGYFMRQRTGIKDPALNLARNWARVGSPASGPAPGVIGVMAHHVFEVVQVVAPGRVLAISGNDGHAVKTRVRSTSSVIAWRRV